MNNEIKKISARLPLQYKDENKINEFITGAENNIKKRECILDLTNPWDDPKLSEKLHNSFLLRLSEIENVKLDFIAKKLDKSKQKVLREILIPVLDKLIDKYKD